MITTYTANREAQDEETALGTIREPPLDLFLMDIESGRRMRNATS
jgi:hypothetical protein